MPATGIRRAIVDALSWWPAFRKRALSQRGVMEVLDSLRFCQALWCQIVHQNRTAPDKKTMDKYRGVPCVTIALMPQIQTGNTNAVTMIHGLIGRGAAAGVGLLLLVL